MWKFPPDAHLVWDWALTMSHRAIFHKHMLTRRYEMFYLTTHSTVYLWLYGIRDMAKDLQIVREETLFCLYILGYSFWLVARVLLYAPSNRQGSTYHGICCISHESLAGTRNSSMSLPCGIDPTTHCTMGRCSTIELHLALVMLTAALIKMCCVCC